MEWLINSESCLLRDTRPNLLFILLSLIRYREKIYGKRKIFAPWLINSNLSTTNVIVGKSNFSHNVNGKVFLLCWSPNIVRSTTGVSLYNPKDIFSALIERVRFQSRKLFQTFEHRIVKISSADESELAFFPIEIELIKMASHSIKTFFHVQWE